MRKVDIHNLNIPLDDIDCWTRYPRHHWVYDLSRLLDAQGLKWSPFATENNKDKIPNLILESNAHVSYNSGYIYTSMPVADKKITEVFLLKGEIKHIRHTDSSNLVGEIELRISAFIALHFQKFTGIITVITYGNNIYSISLRAHSDIEQETDAEIIKLYKKIYKKIDSLLTGLTDQTQEVVVS